MPSEYAATSELLATHLNPRRFGDPAFLDWFYGANPRGRAIVEDIDDDNGRRIAHYGVLPTTFRTPAGPTPFIFTSNVATDPGARRKGLFREMAERIYPRAAATGAPGLAGTTNAASSVDRRREVRLDEPRFDARGRVRCPASRRVASATCTVDAAFLAERRVRRARRRPRLGSGARLGAVVDARLPALAPLQSRRAVRAARRARRARGQHPRSRPARHPGRGALQGVPPPGRDAARCTRAAYVTAACRAHRAPVCVYGGWNAHVKVRGVTIPARFRPSPLVVVFKSFDEERAPSRDVPARHVRVPRHRRVLMPLRMSSPVTFTLDVEDYTEGSAEPRALATTRRILAFLAERDVRGTFFVVGEFAEAQPRRS